MRESELLADLREIAGGVNSAIDALKGMEALLSERLGTATLILKSAGDDPSAASGFSVAGFLESREFPFRGVYSEKVERAGKPAGTLLACFGTWGAPSGLLRAVTAQAAKQIGALL
jgi:hypothetical protein